VVSINNNDPETIQAIEQIVKNPKYETKIILNEKLGISSNTNKALENASGDVIKILFQDDFLASPWSLWHTAKAFRKSKIQWLVSQTKVYEQELETITRTFIPKISDSLLEGKNTISSPSVVALRKKNLLPFDEELRILMDCEWYVRMSHSYGPPSFTRKVIAINRDHKGQEQKRNPQTLKLESSIAKNKHRNQFMKKQECICRKEKPDLKV
jgi:glycosyltransferase involved in cell wall biosynthesis